MFKQKRQKIDHHVLLGNSLGDANDQRNFGLQGFQDGGGSAGRGHVDDGGIGLGFGNSLKRGTYKYYPMTVVRSNTIPRLNRNSRG